MKFQIKFKSIDHSQALSDYAVDKLSRLEKYEVKPVRIHLTFSMVRHQKVAEVYFQGVQSSFRAKATGNDFHECLNLVLDKLERQLKREKAKVQEHHKPERTNLARLERAIKEEREQAHDVDREAA